MWVNILAQTIGSILGIVLAVLIFGILPNYIARKRNEAKNKKIRGEI